MNKSNQLKQLEIIKNRCGSLNIEDERELQKLLRGYQGEKEIEEAIKFFGSPNWFILSDYWYRKNIRQDEGKGFQADFIIMMEDRILLVEVKNYRGSLEYKRHRVVLEGKILDGNIFTTMSAKQAKLREILETVDTQIPIESIMVFIDQDIHFDIQENLDFEVLMKGDFIARLDKYATASHGANGKKTQLLTAMEKYRIPPFYQPKSVTNDQFELLKKGISCKSCHHFNLTYNYKTLLCTQCGTIESKKDAVIRSAVQLRLLYFENPELITRNRIFQYLGETISECTIYRSMGKAFNMAGKGKAVYYEIVL